MKAQLKRLQLLFTLTSCTLSLVVAQGSTDSGWKPQIKNKPPVTIWSISKGKQVGSVEGDGIMQFSPTSMELAVTDGDSLIVYVP